MSSISSTHPPERIERFLINTSIKTAWALGAASTLLALAGCGNPGASGPDAAASPAITNQPTSAPSTARPATPSAGPATKSAAAEILIKDFKYQGTDTVSPGAAITVTNEDLEAHTITADTGAAFDTIIKAGTGTFTAPAQPGTYPYHCTFHGNTHGTLTVK
ncbi:cupredoxin domain-containing protein [Arthrobacter sp. UYEF21]|uniref:cupredoxin domain-containing protein n=1 Tax=Arthrobacter sp. UYEF21 TaxID=1756364 RepID=UPI003397DD1E